MGWFIILAIIFIIWLFKTFYKQQNLPHGPMPVPFFGNMLLLRNDIHTTLDRLSSKYGSLFTVWFARTPIIVVSDFNIAEEVMSSLKFTDRPNFINDAISRNRQRLAFMPYGDKFKSCQSICMRSTFPSAEYLDKCISGSISKLISHFNSEENDFNPASAFENTVLEIMSKVIYGLDKRMSFAEINLLENEDLCTLSNMTTLMSWVRLYNLKKYYAFQSFVENRNKMFINMYNESVNLDESESIAIKLKNAFSEEKCMFGDSDKAEIMCSDMFLFGAESLIIALEWILLFLIMWPEIQDRVQDELEQVERADKSLFTVEEASHVTYLQAAIYETLRQSSMNTLSAIQVACKDVTLRSYKLSKGVGVCVNLSSIHHSTKHWENPFEFDPSRFIDENGQLRDVDKMKGFLPFGRGIRKCIATSLSMKILATILANLLQNFDFELSPSKNKPTLSVSSRMLLIPPPYHIRLTPRKDDL